MPAEPKKVDELQAIVKTEQAWTAGNLILSDDDRKETAEHLVKLRGYEKQLNDLLDPDIKKAHELHKSMLATKKTISDPLAQAIAADVKAITDYDREQKEAAEKEQRRLQAIADEAARKEREEKEAEENRQRLLAEEAQRKAAELRKKAAAEEDTAKRNKLLAEQAQAEAAQTAALDRADAAEAEKLQAVAPIVAAPPTAPPKTPGVSTRSTWKGEIVNLPELCKFICANNRHDLIEPNQKIIDAYAKAMGKNATMPGVVFKEVASLAVRGAK